MRDRGGDFDSDSVEGVMHVDFEQSGGFANITFGFRADLNELPEETAKELRAWWRLRAF